MSRKLLTASQGRKILRENISSREEKKTHCLIFDTYHRDGISIPYFKPNYEYQYSMQQHLNLKVITLILLS